MRWLGARLHPRIHVTGAMEEVGPAVVFACHLLHLMPHYYLLNALILAQRQERGREAKFPLGAHSEDSKGRIWIGDSSLLGPPINRREQSWGHKAQAQPFGGWQDQEWFMHSALLQSELLSVALEMLWSAYHPEAEIEMDK